jgi:acyl phosphate:glycerol-3-phosphate acyltransferase
LTARFVLPRLWATWVPYDGSLAMISMDTALALILAFGAYMLGACPFSVWIGRVALRKDIRDYGDGNPGSSNVFKAGGGTWGVAALIADIAKGVPFILMGSMAFGLAQPFLYFIAFSAILGHAFSPFLRFRGGKALAVFAGTLLGLMQWDQLFCIAFLLILGFLFIGNDSWTVVLSTLGGFIFAIWMKADAWEIVFVGCVTGLFILKHFRDLHSPSQAGRLIGWLRSRKRTA